MGCAKGFEIVDLDTLETQSLLDPADTSLDFIQRKEKCSAYIDLSLQWALSRVL